MEGDIVKILYTGFKGKNNSSFQLLSKLSGEKVHLTNSFDGLERDIVGISDNYDMVVMFGLDSNMKEMVRIELVAECEGAVEKSRLDCNALCRCLKESKIQCCVSEIPTRYLCNAAYYHMLRKVEGNAVFIHIPTMKNMSGIMLEKIVSCMEGIAWNSICLHTTTD